MSPVARGSEDRDRGFSGKVVRSGRRQAGGLPCDRKAGRDSPAKRRVAEPGAWQLSHFGGGAWALFRPVLVSLPWTSRLSPAPSQPSFRRKRRFIRPVLTEHRGCSPLGATAASRPVPEHRARCAGCAGRDTGGRSGACV